LVNISRENEKGAKNSYGSYPTDFFFFLSDPKGEVFNLKAYFKKRADKILHLYSHDTAPARRTAGRWNFFFS
jgi:hypothetical protein